MGIFENFRRFIKKKVDKISKQKICEKLKRMKLQKIGPIEVEIVENDERKCMKMNFTYTFIADYHQSDQQYEQQYMILWEHTKANEAESERIDIKILPVGTQNPFERIKLSAKLLKDSWFLSCIQSEKEGDYQRKGFWTIMMIAFFDIVDVESSVKKIEGNLEPAMKIRGAKRFYRSFSGYEDDKKLIEYDLQKRNKIEYCIISKSQKGNAP